MKSNRVIAEFEVPPLAVAEVLQWGHGHLQHTLEEIDGHHGSLELLYTVAHNMHLFRKVI